MRTVIVIPLKILPMSANDQRRAHWTEMRKAKETVDVLVRHAVNRSQVPTYATCTARLVWYAPDARARDTDNMYPMLKACLDSLVKAGVLQDDNCRIVSETVCGPIIISRDNPRFELILEGSSPLPGGGPGTVLPRSRSAVAGSEVVVPEVRGENRLPGGSN